MSEIILKISNLRKQYRDFMAVSDISFSVAPGEVVGLLGPNGAGKTTTINMILGILEPTSGLIEFLGKDANLNRSGANQRMNFSAVYAHLPGNLTVWQNLYVFGALYGVDNLKQKVKRWLSEYELEEFAAVKLGLLSSGEQTRVNLAKATINEPCLLLLDEPTASLDPGSARIIRERIKKYATDKNAGILWTSHNMQEIEAVCDRVLFLSHGKILLQGDPKTLPREHGQLNLEELFIAIAREPLAGE
ncbi:MAG: ABC transporter ATP-binding protein [bacterium]|nr:ABC transporter ATP-binding protein [bacterium]